MQIKITMRYYLTSVECLLSKRQKISVGNDVKKRESLCTGVTKVNLYSCFKNTIVVTKKIKNRFTIGSSIPTTAIYIQRK
jgi:hypothetical protein